MTTKLGDEGVLKVNVSLENEGNETCDFRSFQNIFQQKTKATI